MGAKSEVFFMGAKSEGFWNGGYFFRSRWFFLHQCIFLQT